MPLNRNRPAVANQPPDACLRPAPTETSLRGLKTPLIRTKHPLRPCHAQHLVQNRLLRGPIRLCAPPRGLGASLLRLGSCLLASRRLKSPLRRLETKLASWESSGPNRRATSPHPQPQAASVSYQPPDRPPCMKSRKKAAKSSTAGAIEIPRALTLPATSGTGREIPGDRGQMAIPTPPASETPSSKAQKNPPRKPARRKQQKP